ncbi:FHA domain-containing protein [Crateriforma conspicua]|uniref:FHA domain protein n=1 Tax=Crateriforma conspicua TaxID=2527996 RepID=A0A5C6FWQ4_9PLAN|nr:FHA domain-containing protein [Crateriforma conspicua]TWU66774.1 FHA domain protein [Crateriforma conspicua]
MGTLFGVLPFKGHGYDALVASDGRPCFHAFHSETIAVQDREFPEFAGKFGQLTPCGGGDPIPLVKERLLVGRRPSCDIQLKFPNVSSNHCRFSLESGYWFIKDLGSRNGTKVDGRQIMRKRADPKCKVSIAKHHYILEYEPQALGAFGPPPADDDYVEEMLKSSLMDRAGLSRRDGKKSTNRDPLAD